MTPSLLSNELVAVAASGGARWEQICRARWCWEPTGRVWWLFILTRRGPVWRESTLYQGARAFPGACATVLLHPEEVQSRKVKQSLGSGEDSAKPYSLSELNPRCGCTPPPPNAVEKRNPLVRGISPVLEGGIATEKLYPGHYLAHLILLFYYPANKKNSNTTAKHIYIYHHVHFI